MKITNTTKWDTNDLRKLFAACVKAVYKIEKKKGARLEVQVENRRYNRGRARVNGHWVLIGIGRHEDLTQAEAVRKLARIFIHEFYHHIGYWHQDYRNYKNDFTERFDTSFADAYAIGLKKTPLKPKIDLQEVRYQKALRFMSNWGRRAKAATNKFKKYQKQVKRYEMVFAMKGKTNDSISEKNSL